MRPVPPRRGGLRGGARGAGGGRGRGTARAREKDDGGAASTKLRGGITILKNGGRGGLMRALERVDAHFAQLFAILFEGGQGAFKLTEDEDPLEGGLEIYAQPP